MRTLTFNMTDALISPESFAVLSGADVIDASEQKMYVHTTTRAVVERIEDTTLEAGKQFRIFVDLDGWNVAWDHAGEMNSTDIPAKAGMPIYKENAEIFLMEVNGSDMEEPVIPYDKGVYYLGFNKDNEMVDVNSTDPAVLASIVKKVTRIECYGVAPGKTVLVDYYTEQSKGKQIEITPDKFGGYFYLEGSTLWRNEDTGNDDAAEIVIPRCKVQSNFTFTMASTGDPSTFDFVLDAFPDYSKFDTTKKVLAILQVVEDSESSEGDEELMRSHIEKTDIGRGEGEDKNHKTRYGAANEAHTNYAAADDNVASSDFRSAP